MEAKIFKSGNSQAVRIPKEFRLEGTSVEIFKRGDELVLKPKPVNLGAAFKLMGAMPADFMEVNRQDQVPQSREEFWILVYILDTNICIYIIKKQPPSVLQRFESMAIGSLAMSVITYGELQYRAAKSNNSTKARGVLAELKNYIPVLPLDNEVASHYAKIRAELESAGKPIGNNDLWIAAHTLALGHTLVSNNIKEFSRIPQLSLENWVWTTD